MWRWTIYTHKNVKCIPLVQYEVDGLEAVWAEVMCNQVQITLGSVYIPPGEFQQMNPFGKQLSRVEGFRGEQRHESKYE